MSRPVDRAAGAGAGPEEMPYLPETATGEITAAGQVGTVAGIRQKMVAAGAAGARPGPGPRAAGCCRSPLPGWHPLDGLEHTYRRCDVAGAAS